jgi:PPOX class probable F420-dependent enzyme
MASEATNDGAGRAGLAMTDTEIDGYIATALRVQVATINADGTPHVVPMAYLVWEGRIGLWTDPRSRKVVNLRRDPRVTLLLEDGQSFETFRAVQLRGTARIYDDREVSRQAGEVLFSRYGGLDDAARAQAETLAAERVLVVIDPVRTISWDHRKLGGAGLGEIGH